MLVSMCWKQLQGFPTLVSCVITQLSHLKLTSNLADTYTNGLKLLAVSFISEGQFWWGSWQTNFKSIYCGMLPICEHASTSVITRYKFSLSISALASNDLLILSVANVMSTNVRWCWVGTLFVASFQRCHADRHQFWVLKIHLWSLFFWSLWLVGHVVAFVSVLHMYESFGWWRRADYLKVHFAESWNELHHLLTMEVGNTLSSLSMWSVVLWLWFSFIVSICSQEDCFSTLWQRRILSGTLASQHDNWTFIKQLVWFENPTSPHIAANV